MSLVIEELRTNFVANRKCFDCSQSFPSYANLTYGVFICTYCSQNHRNNGFEVVSVFKSYPWTSTHICMMQSSGNERAAKYIYNKSATEDRMLKYGTDSAAQYLNDLTEIMNNNEKFKYETPNKVQNYHNLSLGNLSAAKNDDVNTVRIYNNKL